MQETHSQEFDINKWRSELNYDALQELQHIKKNFVTISKTSYHSTGRYVILDMQIIELDNIGQCVHSEQ